MSDPATEPGAPAGSDTKMPSASEKSLSNEAKKRVPPKLVDILRTPDRIILRLNKMLASPGGLSSFLSTFNYTLYLLAYLEAKSAPLQARLYQLINRVTGKPLIVPAAPVAGASSIAALGSLLGSTRTTLRLLGLFPMYAWFRQLMQGPTPGQDAVLYATALTQCSLYIAFQFLENVGLLADQKVLPASATARWTASAGGKTSAIYLWSYRAWFGGVLCDIVRLAREAQLESAKRGNRVAAATEEERKVDEKWWSDLVVPVSWVPVAAQFSVEGGFSWFNMGVMGACGVMASLSKTAALWDATADVGQA